MYFPLKFRCTISSKGTTRDAAGQTIESLTTVSASEKCLFYETSGNKMKGPQEKFTGLLAFYVSPDSEITEGHIVTNIRTVDGTVIESGPFEAKKVSNVVSHLTGKVHHKSCKLEGAS